MSLSLHHQLLERYKQIIKNHQDFVDSTLTSKELSKLFLASVPSNYQNAKNKILIIGRETRGWHNNTELVYDHVGIELLMAKNKKYMESQLNPTRKMDNKATFFNFVRQIAKQSGSDGLLWGNMYALDFKEKHINHSKDLKLIENLENLSIELLKAQVETLQPNIIIFATGKEGVKLRRKFCSNDLLTDKRTFADINIKNLWSFKLPNNSAICYRIHHPSSWSTEKRQVREYLINLLPTQ